jgi:hypothetical protein
MEFEWDEHKNKSNIEKHGVDFIDAKEMFSSPMLVKPDERKNYSETRFQGSGYIGSRLMVVVYSKKGETIRIISLRKANKRETKRFLEKQQKR